MKMKPMGDSLLLKAKERQTKTKTGIILSSNESAFEYAEVILVGDGLYTQTGDRIPMTCKVGDTIMAPARLLSGKNGNDVTIDDIDYVLVRESEILMVSTK
tara:strand:- start:1004 stop:1306 length:303 start_codon:yes stop_codon:yes gene_type:complete